MKPYFDRSGITIYCGDCLEVMPRLDRVFDAIIADLPYGTTACSWDTVIPFEPLWENYKRLIKDNGAVVLFGSQPFTSKLIMSNLEWFRQEIIWKKQHSKGFLNARRYHLNIHENILLFCSSLPNYNPQGLRSVSVKNGRINKAANGVYRNVNASNYMQTEGNFPKSVLHYDAITQNNCHPTQKPVALLAYLIRTYTNPGELILDNTMGSGTTLLAAQNEGRRAVGIELSEEYCKIAVDRLRQPSFFSIPNQSKEKKPEQLEIAL